MKPLKTVLALLTSIAFLSGGLWSVFWLARKFFLYVGQVPKEVGASLIAGIATVLVATFTVALGRYFERKKELDALYREKKTEIYDEFLKKFFELSSGGAAGGQLETDLVPFFREFTRKLILWSGPNVIKPFVAWKDSLQGTPNA